MKAMLLFITGSFLLLVTVREMQRHQNLLQQTRLQFLTLHTDLSGPRRIFSKAQF
jgi:hypothetical protein